MIAYQLFFVGCNSRQDKKTRHFDLHRSVFPTKQNLYLLQIDKLMELIKQYIAEHKQRLLDELFDLLRFPSVSADPKYKQDILNTADFVAQKLRDAGADNVEICETAGNPIVYGEKIIDTSKPTVLVYGHYDVQPPEPLELWKTPPFEPTIRDGKIYARGACDDKGQFYMHVKAFELMMQNRHITLQYQIYD